MYRAMLEGRGDLTEWRDRARMFLLAGVGPDLIGWHEVSASDGLLGLEEDDGALPPQPSIPGFSVPAAFLDLAEAVICHADPGRFALLYRILWRLRDERQLLRVLSDSDVARARLMERSVRRDCHKMTAFVRFKEIDPDIIAGSARRRNFHAWFEPDHHIVARVAPFFQRRFTDMDWLITTPKGSAAWDGSRLATSGEPAEKQQMEDVTDDLWKTYFANIFNPARLKVKAMQAEMPKKYWKNLPEAELIPGMIADAEARIVAMAKQGTREPPAFHHRLQAAASRAPAEPDADAGTLEDLRAQARDCTRCPLHCHATQTVFGEGPAEAEVMFVGEQPGDQEDLAGQPFVGPAGRVFDAALSETGLDRRSVYVTNAVKHFKYEPRGKRRIHQKPNIGEVQTCRWWLKQEIALVRPKIIVALGATAVFALTDNRGKLADVRGRVMEFGAGQFLLATVHPSYLLRLPDEFARQDELRRFSADIARVRALADRLAAP